MRRKTFKKIALSLFLVLAGLLALLLLPRPWYMRWGATDAEIAGRYPGDQLSKHPQSLATRAVTIAAPVAEVWPWIVQTGQDRAGFYSYTWLENLFRAGMHNADRIIPEFQDRKAGDTVWLASKYRYGGQGRVVVALLQPNRAMVLVRPGDMEAVANGGELSLIHI